MIHLLTGNILRSEMQALVNPVNTVGVMGAGLAKEFKQRFPKNFANYAKVCRSGAFTVGTIEMFQEDDKYICNFPTKDHWKNTSKLADIHSGLLALRRKLLMADLSSVAIPAIGCGLGGLSWDTVYPEIINTFIYFHIEVEIYWPL